MISSGESADTFVVGRPNITQFPASPDRRPPHSAADAFVGTARVCHPPVRSMSQYFWEGIRVPRLKHAFQAADWTARNAWRRAMARCAMAAGLMQGVRKQETILDIEALPDFVPLSWIAAHFVCKRCGGVSVYILPSWTGASTTEHPIADDGVSDSSRSRR